MNNNLADRPAPLLIIDLMHEALRVKDERLNVLAIELFARAGGELVRRLVLEAACRRNPRGYRPRLLRAIGRIGPVTDPTCRMDLLGLPGDRNAQIRAAAAGLLHEVAPEPETAGVARR
jgi:hypothetical protein